eukprot:2940994-Alexandrium_andersonii.AAC.1
MYICTLALCSLAWCTEYTRARFADLPPPPRPFGICLGAFELRLRRSDVLRLRARSPHVQAREGRFASKHASLRTHLVDW